MRQTPYDAMPWRIANMAAAERLATSASIAIAPTANRSTSAPGKALASSIGGHNLARAVMK